MKTAVEQFQSVRYMLCCLVFKVKYYSFLYDNNRGVIQNITILDSQLKNKRVEIFYHSTTDPHAEGTVRPIKISVEKKFADIMIKPVTEIIFWMMYEKLTWG